MAPLDLSNLLAYTAQGIVLAIIATAAHATLRLHAPGVSYVYWRCALAAALFAPLVLVRPEAVPGLASGQVASLGEIFTAAPSAPVAASRLAVDWQTLAIVIICAGIVLRFVWLARSFARLGALRRSGRPAGSGEAYEDMQRRLGTRAEIRFVPDLAMPVTFGVWRPVVLLPAAICDRPGDIRSAIAAHELVHVQRRDWLWHLAEETICALLWFSPAVWWLVSRVHLSREAAVDAVAVMITGKRRSYLEALVSFADDGEAALMPAFARRRHLFLRIQSLSREAVMSSKRVVLSSGVLALVLMAGTVAAAAAFPVTSSVEPEAQQAAAGPIEQRAKPVSTGEIPRRVDYVAAEYPMEARTIGAGGAVTLRVTLDELGRPAEARPTAFSFTLLDPPVNGGFSLASQADMEAYLRKRMTEPQATAMLSALNAFAAAAQRAVQQWRYEAPAGGPVSFTVVVAFRPDGEVMSSQRGASTATSSSSPLQSASGLAPIRVGGNIKPPIKIRDVRPVYPSEAKEARVRGLVIVEALIGTDGAVEDARILRSIPLLDEAALEAVRQWRFTPTLLNGQAVPVIMTVTVNFTLDSAGMSGAGAGVSGTAAAPRTANMPRVVYEVKPQYTPEAMAAKVEGTIVTEVTIGTDGSVTDARVLRGIPMLDEQALAAVRRWRFEPPAQPVVTTIELTFRMR